MGCCSSKVANEEGTGFSSVISPQLPAILSEFRSKSFTLLWRGSRDGFSSRAFHGRCDGHANTLTFILDKCGNVFGGYTPVAWESRTRDFYKPDPTGKSFIFTIKNPSNTSPKTFALRSDKKNSAIACEYSWGPTFGEGDIFVSANANEGESSYARYFGDAYKNDTKVSGTTFFTGSANFTLQDIEVFELDAPRSAPAPPAAPALPPPGPLDSAVAGDFLQSFPDFAAKQFVRLWRGSGDGFAPQVFHARCDGRANTLVIVQDSAGNVFGGFSAAAWESPPFGQEKADSTKASFLFSLRNPHGKPPAQFPLRPTAVERAIWCDAGTGPAFGEDIVVYNQTNAYSKFGGVYRNDTGIPETTFFAGMQCFKLNEVEAYEVVG
jgi:hypothetical protein